MAQGNISKPPTRLLSPLLAFVSGFVDAAVFVHMGGLFVAHVTGNFVLIGATLSGVAASGHGSATVLQLASFPVFFVAAFLAARLSRRNADRGATRLLLWLTVILLALGSGLALALPATPEGPAMVFAFAMGVLNAAHRLDPALGSPFTVMTGNVTAIAVNLAGAGPAPMLRPTIALTWLVSAFAIGCVAGAFADQWAGMAVMLFPAALLALRLAFRRPEHHG